jgi:hypothetical protein
MGNVLFLVLILLSLVLVLGISLGGGWLLTRFLPFSLFEATLLTMLASTIVGVIWYRLLRTFPEGESEESFGEEAAYGPDQIPASQFYQTDLDKTWEAWLRYRIANYIHWRFQGAPNQIAPLDDKQVQALAIRLAEIGVAALKAKPAHTTRLRITRAELRRQMSKMGQQPYTDDILGLAVLGINETVSDYYPFVIEAITDKLWDEPADV